MKAVRLREGFIHLSCLFLLSFSFEVLAASGITYQGRLLDPSGVPVTSNNVQFKMQIRTPGTQDCLLYEEVQSVDLSLTSGVFALSVGDGSGTRTDAHASDWNLFEALANRSSFSFSSGECTGATTYTPNSDDNRKFRVFFNLGSGWEALPVQTINYIPMSIETYAVGGFPASALFRVEDAGALGNVAALTTTQYNNLVSLADGTSSTYEKSGSLNGSTLPSIGSGESVRWNGTSWESYAPLASGDEADPTVEAFAKTSLPTCLAGEVLKSDGSVLSCVTDTSGTLPDVGTAGIYTKVTTDAKGRVTSGSALLEADLPSITTAGKVSGDAITSGEISGSTSINTSGNITTTGNITATGDGSTSGVIYGAALQTRRLHIYDDDTNFVTLKTPADLSADYALTLPPDKGTSGQVLSTDGSGTLSWISPSTGSVTSVTGTSPIVITGTASAPVVTLDDSGVGAATYGSATQVPVFEVDEKGLIQSVTNTTISGVSPVGSTLSTGKAWVGDASGDAQEVYINVSDLKKSDGTNQIPTTCTASQTLTWSSLTDVFTCTNISIASTQITGLGTAAAKDFGSSAGNLVELDSGGKIPSSLLPSGTSTQWTTTGSDIYYDDGNVGIGTTSPSSTLDVLTSTGLTVKQGTFGQDAGGMINLSGRFDGTATNFTRFAALMGAKENGTSGNDAGYFSIYTAPNGSPLAERLRIDSDGNVGIGTTDPEVSLDIGNKTDAIRLPAGTTAEQPAASANGMLRYNSDNNKFEAYENGAWVNMIGGTASSATSVSAGAGSAASPSIAFSGDSDTGFYSSGTDTIGISAGGSKVWDITTSGIVSPTAGGAKVNSANGDEDAPTFSFAGDTDTGWFLAAPDTLAASTGGTERMRIDSSGNVGIGTTAPYYLLQVTSTIGSASLGIVRSDNSSQAAKMEFMPVGANSPSNVAWAWGMPTGNNNMQLDAWNGSVATNMMTIENSGDVGIGTTAPGSKLSLADDAATGLSISGTNTNASLSPQLLFMRARGTLASPQAVQSGDFLGTIYGLGYGATAYSTSRAKINLVAGENWTDSEQGAYIAFETTALGGTSRSEKLRIDPSGNVGIGTTAPNYLLHVEGPTGGHIGLTDAAASGARILMGDGTSGVGLFSPLFLGRPVGSNMSTMLLSDIDPSEDTGSDPAMTFIARRTGAANLTTRSLFQWRNNTTSLMAINAAGNVGIGTTNPGERLHVVESGNNTWATKITQTNATASNGLSVQTQTTSANDYALRVLSNAGATVGLAVKNDGNVGIGTTTVTNKLTISNGGIDLDTDGVGDYAGIWEYNGGLTLSGAMQSMNRHDMHVSAAGQVGIGTTSPGSPLEVIGSSPWTTVNWNRTAKFSNALGSAGAIQLGGGTYSMGIGNNGNNMYFFKATGETSSDTLTYMMYLKPNGDMNVTGCVMYSGGTVGTCASDERLKKDVHPFDLGLDRLLGIQPVFYKYNGLGGQPEDQKDRLGVIAQEVEKVAPELVETRKVKMHEGDTQETEIKVVNYNAFTYMLINAVKELYEKWTTDRQEISGDIQSLQEEVKGLRRLASEQQKTLLELQSELKRMKEEQKKQSVSE